jgi:hypothetical protein
MSAGKQLCISSFEFLSENSSNVFTCRFLPGKIVGEPWKFVLLPF